MYTLSIISLVLAVLLQSGAALVALLQLGRVRGYRLAWGFISLALSLMVLRRLSPLELALSSGLFDADAAFLDLLISAVMLAGTIGLRIVFRDLDRQRGELQILATTDPLTSLLNRREFFTRATQEIVRSQRNHEPLALFMVDLDLFKRVNDRFGHGVGDAVLVAVSETLSAEVRRIDIASRIGGEEFAVLLPNTSSAAALLAAERLRQAIADLKVGTEAVTITASIGIAIADEIPDTANADSFLRSLLQESDTALYTAKGHGRNRVETWSADMIAHGS